MFWWVFKFNSWNFTSDCSRPKRPGYYLQCVGLYQSCVRRGRDGGLDYGAVQTKPENTNNHVARLLSGRWASGRSPNPGGRPKIIADVRDLARQHTRTALDTLVEIAVHGKTEIARICAANSLLDRGYGKPPVSLELREPDPEHIIELIADAERHTRKLFAAPLAITDSDGSPSENTQPSTRLRSSLGR